MKKQIIYILNLTLALYLCLFTTCSSKPGVPAAYTDAQQSVSIYPDYKDIIIPPNIAPLNFLVRSPGKEFVAVLAGKHSQLEASSSGTPSIILSHAIGTA